MRLQVLLVVLSVTLRSGDGERGGMAGRRRSKDGSLQILSAETRGPQSSSNRPFAFHGPNANGEVGAVEKIPSPLPFPTRLPKNGHNIVFLPGGSATALNNGRDLMTVPRAPGVGINFGAEKNGQDGTTNTVPRTTPKPPPVTTAPASVTGNVDSGAGAGGSGTVYRRRSSPGCTRGSKALPCEVDDEYTDEIADRISHLLYASRMNAIIDDATFSQFLNDTAVVDDGKTFDLPTTRNGFVTESPACRAQESIIYPQRAKTASDDWVFVLNQDGVRQGVRVEKCLREGEQCHLGGDLPPTIRTTCRQKFIYRKLLVLGETGTSIQPESVLLPSCCVCYIRRSRGLRRDRPAGSSPAHPLAEILDRGDDQRAKMTRSKSFRRRNKPRP